jgi:FtsH-binding integral membrane protein
MSEATVQTAVGPTAPAVSRTATRDRTHELLGKVMGLVAATVAAAALGAYLGRNTGGMGGLILFLPAFACVFGLNFAASRRQHELAVGFLLGLGLFLGLAVAPVISYYADSDPAALWQATGVTAAFVAALGSYGYASRRDLSSWYRGLFWALLGLIVLGILLIFVSIPQANVIYGVLGIVIFGGFTIVDFNRLRRADSSEAVPIAAGIFLDIFNVFLLVLGLFGGQRE